MASRLPSQIIVPAALHGERLDVALTQLLGDYSRSVVKQWIVNGQVKVNQAIVKPRDKIKVFDEISIAEDSIAPRPDCLALLPEAISLDIVYEDEHLLVVNKPAGLVVHPGSGNPSKTLVNGLLHYHAPLNLLPRAGIIHRLDKDTTGLLIVAKDLTAHQKLTQLMAAREIKRHYTTLVHGQLIVGGEIHTGFGRSAHNRLKMAVTPGGKEAITHYRILKKYQGMTLLDVSLMTGRTHQIRVHMAHIKHPVVGDTLYTGRSRLPPHISIPLKEALMAFKRQALHARSLEFTHPITGEALALTANLPDDFQQLLSLIENVHEELS